MRKQRKRCFPKEAGNFENVRSLDRSPRRMFSDPLYAVVGESTSSNP